MWVRVSGKTPRPAQACPGEAVGHDSGHPARGVTDWDQSGVRARAPPPRPWPTSTQSILCESGPRSATGSSNPSGSQADTAQEHSDLALPVDSGLGVNALEHCPCSRFADAKAFGCLAWGCALPDDGREARFGTG